MSRGGPAAGGSFQRSHSRPQSASRSNFNRTGSRQSNTQRQDNFSNRSDNRQDNLSDRNDNRQDRADQRQDNLSDRQDFRSERYDNRKEYYDDRKEWYEDRWRRGAYVSVASWGRIGCRNTVIVNGITYYDCGGVRYERVYRGTQVTYVIVN
jgi:hypothetical protein